MNYDIEPKPTEYEGVIFRSRLEAKWAAFFDLIEWDWIYEPCEINGYSPDFIINCTSDAYKTNTIIVEVKPSMFADDRYEKELIRKYNGVRSHLLLLTENPFYENDYGNVVIGKGIQSYISEEHTDFGDLEMKCSDDFGSTCMYYDGMVYGKVERERFISKLDFSAEYIKSKWAKAGNMVQFMKPNKYKYQK